MLNKLRAPLGNLRIFIRIRIRILHDVQSADPHFTRSQEPISAKICVRKMFPRPHTCPRKFSLRSRYKSPAAEIKHNLLESLHNIPRIPHCTRAREKHCEGTHTFPDAVPPATPIKNGRGQAQPFTFPSTATIPSFRGPQTLSPPATCLAALPSTDLLASAILNSNLNVLQRAQTRFWLVWYVPLQSSVV